MEWRVEKSKKSINVEGGFLFCGGGNFSKSVSVGPTFIREMRVLTLGHHRKCDFNKFYNSAFESQIAKIADGTNSRVPNKYEV